MEYRAAAIHDLEAVLALHTLYQADSIAPEDRADGFVTTPFTRETLSDLIEKERGVFIALDGEKVVAYLMAASWAFWSPWPIFAHMGENLPVRPGLRPQTIPGLRRTGNALRLRPAPDGPALSVLCHVHQQAKPPFFRRPYPQTGAGGGGGVFLFRQRLLRAGLRNRRAAPVLSRLMKKNSIKNRLRYILLYTACSTKVALAPLH